MKILATALLLAAALLPGCSPRESGRPLFNGHDLAGWEWRCAEPGVAADRVWSAAEGVLLCRGEPKGFLETAEEFGDFELTLEWRWKPGTPGGNSGVLLRAAGPGPVPPWPKCIEAQLKADSAGDLVELGATIDVKDKAARQKGIVIAREVGEVERPPGEWNTMVVACRGATVCIQINGRMVNRGTNASVARGRICLQSEGAEIHFRNLRILAF